MVVIQFEWYNVLSIGVLHPFFEKRGKFPKKNAKAGIAICVGAVGLFGLAIWRTYLWEIWLRFQRMDISSKNESTL